MNHKKTNEIFNALIKMLFYLEAGDLSNYEEEKKRYMEIKRGTQ